MVKRKYLPFTEARRYVRSFCLTINDWDAFCQDEKPKNIPADPERVYKGHGWKGYRDWLGLVPRSQIKWKTFREARAYVCTKKLNNVKEWREYCKGDIFRKGKKPSDIPSAPHIIYRDRGWISYGDWLGTGRVAYKYIQWQPFIRARAFVRRLGLKNFPEWMKFCVSSKLPKDIPANPQLIYKKRGWIGFGDWLGTGYIANRNRKYLPFTQARKYARSLNFRNSMEWYKHIRKKKIPNIPGKPNEVYAKKGWKSWGDWLGTYTLANYQKRFRPFIRARAFVRRLCLKSQSEWFTYCRGEKKGKKKPTDIPTSPSVVYKNKGWISWMDWLSKL